MDVTQDLRVATGMKSAAACTVTRMCVCEMNGMSKGSYHIERYFDVCSLLLLCMIMMYDTIIELIND